MVGRFVILAFVAASFLFGALTHVLREGRRVLEPGTILEASRIDFPVQERWNVLRAAFEDNATATYTHAYLEDRGWYAGISSPRHPFYALDVLVEHARLWTLFNEDAKRAHAWVYAAEKLGEMTENHTHLWYAARAERYFKKYLFIAAHNNDADTHLFDMQAQEVIWLYDTAPVYTKVVFADIGAFVRDHVSATGARVAELVALPDNYNALFARGISTLEPASRGAASRATGAYTGTLFDDILLGDITPAPNGGGTGEEVPEGTDVFRDDQGDQNQDSPQETLKACEDGADNDRDGLTDYPSDSGCTSLSDDDEADALAPAPVCSDGADNDSDGLVDYPADLGCTGGSDVDETDPSPPSPPDIPDTVVLWGPTQIAHAKHAYNQGDPTVRSYIDRYVSLARQSANATPNPQSVVDLRSRTGIGAVRTDIGRANGFAIDYVFNATDTSLSNAREFLIAWARTYDLNGPRAGYFSNVYELVPFVWSFELVRPAMPASEIDEMHDFFRELYESADDNITGEFSDAHAYGNHWSYHAYTAAMIGYLLDDGEIISRARNIFNDQVDWNLFPGGTPRAFYSKAPNGSDIVARFGACGVADTNFPQSTYDWINRDALGYHIISLERLLWAGWVAGHNGQSWLSRRGQQGMVLADGFDLLLDFVSVPNDEFASTCISGDADKVGSWVKQPEDVWEALGCGSLLDGRFSQWFSYADDGGQCTLLIVTG